VNTAGKKKGGGIAPQGNAGKKGIGFLNFDRGQGNPASRPSKKTEKGGPRSQILGRSRGGRGSNLARNERKGKKVWQLVYTDDCR